MVNADLKEVLVAILAEVVRLNATADQVRALLVQLAVSLTGAKGEQL